MRKVRSRINLTPALAPTLRLKELLLPFRLVQVFHNLDLRQAAAPSLMVVLLSTETSKLWWKTTETLF